MLEWESNILQNPWQVWIFGDPKVENTGCKWTRLMTYVYASALSENGGIFHQQVSLWEAASSKGKGETWKFPGTRQKGRRVWRTSKKICTSRLREISIQQLVMKFWNSGKFTCQRAISDEGDCFLRASSFYQFTSSVSLLLFLSLLVYARAGALSLRSVWSSDKTNGYSAERANKWAMVMTKACLGGLYHTLMRIYFTGSCTKAKTWQQKIRYQADDTIGRREGKRGRGRCSRSPNTAKQPRNIILYLPSIVYNKTTPTSTYFYPIKFKFVDAISIIHATKHADTLTNTIFSIISIRFVNKPVQSVKLSISWVESYG